MNPTSIFRSVLLVTRSPADRQGCKQPSADRLGAVSPSFSLTPEGLAASCCASIRRAKTERRGVLKASLGALVSAPVVSPFAVAPLVFAPQAAHADPATALMIAKFALSAADLMSRGSDRQRAAEQAQVQMMVSIMRALDVLNANTQELLVQIGRLREEVRGLPNRVLLETCSGWIRSTTLPFQEAMSARDALVLRKGEDGARLIEVFIEKTVFDVVYQQVNILLTGRFSEELAGIIPIIAVALLMEAETAPWIRRPPELLFARLDSYEAFLKRQLDATVVGSVGEIMAHQLHKVSENRKVLGDGYRCNSGETSIYPRSFHAYWDYHRDQVRFQRAVFPSADLERAIAQMIGAGIFTPVDRPMMVAPIFPEPVRKETNRSSNIDEYNRHARAPRCHGNFADRFRLGATSTAATFTQDEVALANFAALKYAADKALAFIGTVRQRWQAQ